MSLQDVREYRNRFKPEEIEYKIASIFLRQPTQIGPHAGNLRPIVLTNVEDFSIFINAVQRDFDQLKSEAHFSDRDKFDKILSELITLLKK